MSQLTIDLDTKTEQAIAQAAKKDALSVQQWIKKNYCLQQLLLPGR